jgi:SagB-type dehydrogenase family enzyme
MIDAPDNGRDLINHLISGVAFSSREILPQVDFPGNSEHALGLPSSLLLAKSNLFDLITQRRSGGVGRGGTLDLNTLGALLLGAADRLPPSLSEVPPVLCPMALSVEGVRPGCFRYLSDRHALAPITPVTRGFVREDVVLQSEHADAAVIIFLVSSLSRWLNTQGDRGYRSAVLQQGWLTDRLYLRAESLGLSYTASGGFAPAVVDALLGIDGYHLTALFSFVVSVK